MILFLPALVIINEGLFDFDGQIFPFSRGWWSDFCNRLLRVWLFKPFLLGLNIGDEGIDRRFRPESHQFLPHHPFHVILGANPIARLVVVSTLVLESFLATNLKILSLWTSLFVSFWVLKIHRLDRICLSIEWSRCFFETADALLHDCSEFVKLSCIQKYEWLVNHLAAVYLILKWEGKSGI